MKVAVIVPTRSPDLLEMHLHGHRLWTPKDVDILVVDGGLGAWAMPEAWQEEGRRIVSIGHGQGNTYSAWCHFGAEFAAHLGADVLVFANDDTVVTPDWLPTMLEDLGAVRRAAGRPGLLGACSNVCAPGFQLSVGDGGVHKNGNVYARGAGGAIEAHRFSGPIQCPRIVTQFAMVEARAYRAAGGFDVDLPAHSWSDFVLSYRLIEAGYTNAVSRAFVCHFGHRTLGRQDHAADFARGLEYVRAKCPRLGEVLGVDEAR